ncbi:MAG: hypothetical protein E6G84_11845, partial [Alphaproteobacteria bacterium]
PEFAALNPRRKVPVIVDEGFALYESGAIVEYLEDKRAGRAAAVLRRSTSACSATAHGAGSGPVFRRAHGAPGRGRAVHAAGALVRGADCGRPRRRAP